MPDQQFDWDSLEQNNLRVKTKNGSTLYSSNYSQDVIDSYEKTFENFREYEPNVGDKISGIVLSKTDDLAAVDIGWREPAYIDLSKENSEYVKYIQEGYEIDILIRSDEERRTSGHGFTYQGSYSELVKEKLKQEIYEAIGEKIAYPAKVKTLIHGGYFLDIDGVEVFMPGSVAGMNKLTNFEKLLGQTIYVCPVNYSKEKNYIVVSHREYLKTRVPSEVEKLEVGGAQFGFVTGSSKFGVFVEFNDCLTGLIHKSDLDDETAERFESRSIKAGEGIEFNIKEVVDDFRIVLSQKEVVPEVSIWDDIDTKYQVPCQVNGKIKKIAKYGVFIEIEPKVAGLLHKSEVADLNEFKEGDRVDVKLYKIDKEAKKLFFKV